MIRSLRDHPALNSIKRFPNSQLVDRFVLVPEPKFITPYPIKNLFMLSQEALPQLDMILDKKSIAGDPTVQEIFNNVSRTVTGRKRRK